MKEIQLTQGLIAEVDYEEYERVISQKWHAYKGRGSLGFYARANMRKNPEHCTPQITVLMHRFIMRAPKGTIIDHIDGNGLNNKKSNLRYATSQQNGYNRGKLAHNTTGYKGVHLQYPNSDRPYSSVITANGPANKVRLGYFATAKEAAIAYNKAALELH